MARTVANLLSSIKRRAQIPDDGGTLSDSDILAMASEELQTVVFPRLAGTRGWHSAMEYTVSLSSTRTYRLPSRASGNNILAVEVDDGSGYRPMSLTHPLTSTQSALLMEGYYLYGNKVTLTDGAPTSGTLKLKYLLRPSELTSTAATDITVVGGSSITVTSASTAGITTGSTVDIYYSDSPYEPLAIDVTVTNVAGNVLTLSVPTGTAVGMRVALSGQTDRVPLADELHDYLAQRTAMRCMEARGFKEDLAEHMKKLGDLEKAFDRLAAPRPRNDFKAIVAEDFIFDRRI